MPRRLEGRVRYDKENDSFVYEIRGYDVDEDGIETEDIPDYGMCATAKCVRREGAEEDEGTNFIHFDFMKTIVRDVWLYNVEVRMA